MKFRRPLERERVPASVRHATRWFGQLLLPTVVVVVLLTPMLLTHRAFWVDSSNHLWLALQQQRAFDAHAWPSLFIGSDRTGVFSPLFAFYGGSGYAALGAVGALLGNRIILADDISWLLAFAMAFGGLSWLSWQLGLRRWQIHIPGLIFVTSAYYLTNVYERGDWGETMATSAIPLAVASALWLLRSPRWRTFPVLALVVSTATLTATHNITVLWAATFLVMLAGATVWAWWPLPKTIRLRRYLQTLGLAALASLINAWYLVPDLSYASRTAIGSLKDPFFAGRPGQPWFDSPATVFSPWQNAHDAQVQLPVLVILWFLAVMLLARKRLRPTERRIAIGLAAIATAFIGLLLFETPWMHLPRPYLFTQYAFRVTTYVVLVVAGAATLALIVVGRIRRSDRRLVISGLILVVAFGFGAGLAQVWSSESALARRGDALTRPGIAPETWYDQGVFADSSAKTVAVSPTRQVTLDPAREQAGSFSETVDLPAGPDPIVTNVAAGAYFIRVQGVVPIGVTRVPQRLEVRGLRTPRGVETYSYPTNQYRMVVRRPSNRLTGPLQITIDTASSAPVVVGRALSLVALVSLILIVAGVAFRSRRRRTLPAVNHQ